MWHICTKHPDGKAHAESATTVRKNIKHFDDLPEHKKNHIQAYNQQVHTL